ncbi:UbiA family prenyltransferase [Actinospica durhamensis]|uniref:UbiA family prenyltransferase n=1 Tax=Actinospica durhamensis TaxID=1508375 RepID=UPI002484AF15
MIVTVLAFSAGRDPRGCATVAAAVATGQLSVGWSNDRIDLRRDVAARRTDKPLAAGALRPGTVSLAAALALAACVPFSLANGRIAGTVHLVAVAAAWAYNLGVKRTLWSPLPYALAFGLLPAFITLALPGSPWPGRWALAAGALLGVGAHFANVLPDIEDDLGAGVRGLPQRLGAHGSRVAAGLSLAAVSVFLIFGPAGRIGSAGWAGLALSALLACAVPLASRGPRSRLPFLATLGLALLDVALLLLRGGRLT